MLPLALIIAFCVLADQWPIWYVEGLVLFSTLASLRKPALTYSPSILGDKRPTISSLPATSFTLNPSLSFHSL